MSRQRKSLPKNSHQIAAAMDLAGLPERRVQFKQVSHILSRIEECATTHMNESDLNIIGVRISSLDFYAEQPYDVESPFFQPFPSTSFDHLFKKAPRVEFPLPLDYEEKAYYCGYRIILMLRDYWEGQYLENGIEMDGYDNSFSAASKWSSRR